MGPDEGYRVRLGPSLRAHRNSPIERCRFELVAGGKEGAVREQTDQDSRYGDASEEHVEDYYL